MTIKYELFLKCSILAFQNIGLLFNMSPTWWFRSFEYADKSSQFWEPFSVIHPSFTKKSDTAIFLGNIPDLKKG